MSAKEFYSLTLAELLDAIEGYNEDEDKRLQWTMWTMRRCTYLTLMAAGVKNFKEEDIYPLTMDDDLRRKMFEGMPEIKVTQLDQNENGKENQRQEAEEGSFNG